MYLIFDTETTSLPQRKDAPLEDLDNWPRMVELAWQLHDAQGKLLTQESHIVRPDGFDIPYSAEKIHGISTAYALEHGKPLAEVLAPFMQCVAQAKACIGHNIEFDDKIVGAELLRLGQQPDDFLAAPRIDTALASIDFCQLPGGIRGSKFKMPKLEELHRKLFGEVFTQAHSAAYDVAATARCFFALIHAQITQPIDGTAPQDIIYEAPTLLSSELTTEKLKRGDSRPTTPHESTAASKEVLDKPFVHLHVHSQFSVLQATPGIRTLIAKTKALGMPAVALTDLGNMYGAFKFIDEALRHDITPIVGCEVYLSEERLKKKFTKDNPDKRYSQVLLAKNRVGYHNLCQLSSLGFIEGLYGLYPRVDKALVEKYKDGLIATTGSLSGEVPSLILRVGERQAEEAFVWWLQTFGDDFYIELNRHNTEENNRVNETLLRFAKKYNVPYFAANECFYLEKSEHRAHDVLLCIKEGEKTTTPIGHGRGMRWGLPNDEFYFKSGEEMKAVFHDLPEAILTIEKILKKIERYELKGKTYLPKFAIPPPFENEDAYLRHLTYEGAKKRYPTLTPELKERIDFELDTICKSGYAGYFLIVQDFTTQARALNVSVGPGRGSAAGSVVAFCTGITNVDPIAYDLLFERFLNPDRVSMPDIDIDFDDEGRQRVIDYVIDKYGKNQVAQIITYGAMASKSAIRDSARVMDLPLNESNYLAKLVPATPKMTLEKAYKETPELYQIKASGDLRAKVLSQAEILEGTLRNTGVHACGIVITPSEISQYLPIAIAKGNDMLVTQFDNSVIESAGLLKMDFLGLTTLSIIKTAIRYIAKRTGKPPIDIENIPLDDARTFELYQHGDTAGTFQFESPGMQIYLRELKPDTLDDLIAMNALYRPGPMAYIPKFIARKHGREPITYDLSAMEEHLRNTYGVTVYQEQVMLLSQKLANFSKGDADKLRKAMGKKLREELAKLKDKFITGCLANGHPKDIAEKIWKDWESFADYAFNKSHATCYSLLAYQTAYLKANYPAEYMAAVLTHSQNDLSKVTYFINECKRMNIETLGPHINESGTYFEVNGQGKIRFGLGGIKGVSAHAVQNIIAEREANGPFTSIFDFAARIDPKSGTKKTYEQLAQSGAFDYFTDFHRKQYLQASEKGKSLTEIAIRYGAANRSNGQSFQESLFGQALKEKIALPKVESMPPFTELEKLNLEKEVTGVYISGHPLDNFSLVLNTICNTPVTELNDLQNLKNKTCKIGGMVTSVAEFTTKTGAPFGRFTIEDYAGKAELTLWKEDFLRYKSYLSVGYFLYIKGAVQERTWGNHELEFRIQSIKLLSDTVDEELTGIVLRMNYAHVTSDVIAKIAGILQTGDRKDKANRKDKTFWMHLYDEENGQSVKLISRKLVINCNKKNIDTLSALGEIIVMEGKDNLIPLRSGSFHYDDNDDVGSVTFEEEESSEEN